MSTTTPTESQVVYNKRPAWETFRRSGWRHAVAAVIVVYAVFPLLYAFSASVGDAGTLLGSNQLFATFSLENFRELFSDPQNPFLRWFANSLIVASTTAIGAVMMGAAAAYAFSRFRFKGRKTGLMSLLIIQMFPQLLAFVAIFLLLATLSDIYPFLGLNSLLGLIMVYLGGALGANTFLMYGVFNTVPRELDEAARMDGATHAQIYWTIILRLIKPILVVVGLLSFIAAFSDFLMARIILQDPDRWTVAVGLYQFVSVEFGEKWGVFTAGAVVSALPVVLLFLFLQRFIVSGLTGGAVKG
ncbi:sugar ABC transporter permease [Hoyosella altamirensis]|uniref:Arabinogalactan oligomer/maltooligosaccharide transport system permease protein n=1 Tax=Hoyosella altamirensis TaxID=616997 RepID=A0A839RPR3_9ACTN|nr:sugar ABC transporter permease [Hoyosella altamirensis]MBB3038520.1 arabinogalactan oligomer/maltooligosaccharide transport system permease protein [Hoyosella altamirensis]